MRFMDMMKKKSAARDLRSDLRSELDKIDDELAKLDAEFRLIHSAPLKFDDWLENMLQVIDNAAQDGPRRLVTMLKRQATGVNSNEIAPNAEGNYPSILSAGALGVSTDTNWKPLDTSVRGTGDRFVAGLDMPLVLTLLAPAIKTNLPEWLAPLRADWPADATCGAHPTERQKRLKEIQARMDELNTTKDELRSMAAEIAQALT